MGKQKPDIDFDYSDLPSLADSNTTENEYGWKIKTDPNSVYQPDPIKLERTKPNPIQDIIKASREQNFVGPQIQQTELGQPRSREVDPVTKQVLKTLLSIPTSSVEGIRGAGDLFQESIKGFKEGDILGGSLGTGASLLRAGFAGATPFVPMLRGFTLGADVVGDVLGEENIAPIMQPVTSLTKPTSLAGRSGAEIGDLIAQLLIAKGGESAFRLGKGLTTKEGLTKNLNEILPDQNRVTGQGEVGEIFKDVGKTTGEGTIIVKDPKTAFEIKQVEEKLNKAIKKKEVFNDKEISDLLPYAENNPPLLLKLGELYQKALDNNKVNRNKFLKNINENEPKPIEGLTQEKNIIQDYIKKEAFKQDNNLQAKIMTEAGIPEADMPNYALGSVADGKILRSYVNEIKQGKITEQEAIERVKNDYAKMKSGEKEGKFIEEEKPKEQPLTKAGEGEVNVREIVKEEKRLEQLTQRAADSSSENDFIKSLTAEEASLIESTGVSPKEFFDIRFEKKATGFVAEKPKVEKQPTDAIKERIFNNLQWDKNDTRSSKLKLLNQAKKDAQLLRQQGVNAQVKNDGGKWRLFIDGQKQGKRELGLITKTEKVKLEDVEIENENAKKPFSELGEGKKKEQQIVAETFVEASDLPSGLGEKTLKKGIEDIKNNDGAEQSKEAQLVREAAEIVLKEGKEIKIGAGSSETEVISPKQVKEFVREKEIKTEIPIEEESFDLTAPETKTKKGKPQQIEMEGLGAPSMKGSEDYLKPKGKGEETTPLFEQKNEAKGQTNAFADRIISEDAYKKAKENLRKNLGELKSGIDPTILKDYAVIGAYHLENGVRTFAKWSEKMVEEVGEKVKPHLKRIWDESNRVLQQNVSGIKNTVINQERLDRGLEPLVTEGKRKWGKVWNEAETLIKENKVDPRKPQEIINNANLHLDTRQAILEYDKITLRNRINEIQRDKVGAEGNKKNQLEIEQLKLEDALNENDIALKSVGTEEARGLAFRRNLIKDDYTFASIIQQARNLNEGKSVAPEIKIKLEDQARQIEQFEQRIQKLEEEAAKTRLSEVFEETKRKVEYGRRKEKRGQTVKELDAEFEDLVKEFAKAQSFNVGYTAEQMAVLSKMLRNKAQKGLLKIEDVVDEIYIALADKVEGLTKKDLMEALSGYGKFSQLSKEQLDVRLRDLRRQGRILSAIEDIKTNKIPKRSGVERDKLTERVKELNKILNEAKTESGITEPTNLKSYKTRLENEIKKYEEMLKTGDYRKPTRRETVLDEAATKLKRDRDKVKDLVNKELDKINERNKSLGTKIYERGLDVINLLKSTVSGGEFSQVLRQGMVYALNPFHARKIYGKGGAFREQFKYLKSEQSYKDLQKQIENDPNAQTHKLMGIEFTSLKENKISAREEMFQSRFTKYVPWIRPFERSFTGFLDKLRLDIANDVIAQYEKAGLTPKTDANIYKASGSWINNATGRGNFRTGELQSMFEKSSPLLGLGFFSPRLIVSRLQMLNPYYYARLPKYARKLAMKDALGFITTGTALVTLAKLAGADVETDPKSSDFMKIKVGNTRLDIWGGMQQFVVLAERMRSGETKSIKGIVREIDAAKFPFDSKWDVAQRTLIENKLSPGFQVIKGFLTGTEWNKKEPYGIDDALLNSLVPLYYRDMIEAVREQQIEGALLALPGVLGVGVQTFKTEEPEEKPKEKPKKYKIKFKSIYDED